MAASYRVRLFLSTLSLRRATNSCCPWHSYQKISIHALLAESDSQPFNFAFREREFLSTLSLRRATVDVNSWTRYHSDFYPRSPCGERRISLSVLAHFSYFYPRSPCGERPGRKTPPLHGPNFYPRSPCGERPGLRSKVVIYSLFLSTLSLRRATLHGIGMQSTATNFYPRSPCGERPRTKWAVTGS